MWTRVLMLANKGKTVADQVVSNVGVVNVMNASDDADIVR